MTVDTQNPPATDAPASESAAEAPKNESPGINDSIEKLRADMAAPAEEEPEAAAPEGEEPEVEETQPEPEGEEPTAEAENQEGEGDEDEENEEAHPEGEPYVLKLPGRGPDDEDLEVELNGLDQTSIDAIRRMRKGYMRREQYNAEKAKLDTDRAELEGMEAEIAKDPIAFVADKIRNPKIKIGLARDILVELIDAEGEEAEEQYDALMAELAELERDPVRRENYRLKRGQTKPSAPNRTPPSDPEVEQVLTTVRGYVPAGTPEAEAEAFLEDALRGIHRHLVQSNKDTLTTQEVAEITARYRRAYGFESSRSESNKGEPTAPKESSAPAPEKAPARRDPRETGKRFAKASARRREATTTPAGAGAPTSAAPKLKEGAGVADAINALKENMRS